MCISAFFGCYVLKFGRGKYKVKLVYLGLMRYRNFKFTLNSILKKIFYSFLFYSILLYYILFYYIIFYSILLYSILFYSILFYSILFYSILFYSSVYSSVYSILLYSIIIRSLYVLIIGGLAWMYTFFTWNSQLFNLQGQPVSTLLTSWWSSSAPTPSSPPTPPSDSATITGLLNSNQVGNNNYLCTYNLYSPLHNVLDACISITRASGRGLGPGILEFFGLCEMASSR
jgi:hypothetical protein